MTSNEELETYVFYCYHSAYLEKFDTSECEICSYGDDSKEHDECKGTDKSFYSRQKFIANIYPKTRQKYCDQEGIYKLANLCLWDSGDIELDENETIEDASDDCFVCYDENNKEISGFKYLITNKIHLHFIESGYTQFGEWHQDEIHY